MHFINTDGCSSKSIFLKKVGMYDTMKSIPALSLKLLQQILDVTMMLILIQCKKI